MIRIENVEVFGWEAAIRGMRNPMNSWEKSDSYHAVDCGKCGKIEREGTCKKQDRNCSVYECFVIGPNDHDLMMRLAKAGSEHAKYRRMINVTCDITAPLYWWKEFDTYKVGTVANSCSTMHKLTAAEFDLSDFSHDKMDGCTIAHLMGTIDVLNENRDDFIRTNDKRYWWNIVQSLPSSYNQRRTVQMNYEVLASIYHQRKGHKMDEWHVLCDWIEDLPYSEVITLEDN